MLEALKGWIASIVTVVLFMVLVDMILPENVFKKYAKLATGLIVIITILTPVFKFFDRNADITASISEYNDLFNKKEEVINREKVQTDVQKQTINVFKENLRKSIANEIEVSTGKKYDVTEIQVNEDTESYDFGKILSVELKKESDDKTIKPVEEIAINKNLQSSKQDGQREAEVLSILKEKFSISPSAVKFVK
jgi:stage III sporulation protein AF